MGVKRGSRWERHKWVDRVALLAVAVSIGSTQAVPGPWQGPQIVAPATRRTAPEAVLSGAVLRASDDAVIPFKTILLRSVSSRTHDFRVRNDLAGRYQFTVPDGVYRVELEPSSALLTYHRANVEVKAGVRHSVNIYPAFHTGTADTVYGDIALPDQDVHYDQFPVEGDLDLAIQYDRSGHRGGLTTYEGAYCVLTFDTLTIMARTIRLDTGTLLATAEGTIRVDMDGEIIKAPAIQRASQLDLDVRGRTLRVAIADHVEERHF